MIAPPVVGSTFVDMPAAPNGAPITVYGTNVDGPIVVGDTTLTDCPFQNETVYEVPQTGRRLAKTTCWMNAIPEGETTIKAGESDVIPFRVNSGSVSIITSFAEFESAINDEPAPGSVLLLRGFTTDAAVDGRANGGKATLWMREGENDGTANMPIALVGYPGEEASFVVSSVSSSISRSMDLDNNGWIIANLDFDTKWRALSFEGNGRAVGNRFNGMNGPKTGSGTGTVTLGGQSTGGFFLGNTITGGASNWRFDHAIYITDCPDQVGWTANWNYIYGNNFARGPQVIINSQTLRCGPENNNKALASHYVEYNTIDTSSYRGRCLGINSVGWYNSNPTEPGTMYFRNNDLINCGFVGSEDDMFGDSRQGAALAVSRGRAEITENRLYGAQRGIYLGTSASNTSEFLGAVVESNFINVEESEAIFIHSGHEQKVTMTDNTIEMP